MVVQALVSEHGMSQRRACQASGIARSTLRYRPVESQPKLSQFPRFTR